VYSVLINLSYLHLPLCRISMISAPFEVVDIFSD